MLDKILLYTKLQGEKVAKLESITTGSLLRVTPRLLLTIARKNNVPILIFRMDNKVIRKAKRIRYPVQNSEIASQATLLAGQSLLLGGFKLKVKQIHSQKQNPFIGRYYSCRRPICFAMIRLQVRIVYQAVF